MSYDPGDVTTANALSDYAQKQLTDPIAVQQAQADLTGKNILNSQGNCDSVIGTVKVGGKDVVTGTVEVIRDLPRNFGIATFFDYGNAFNHFGDPLEYAAGVGFRVRLPVVTWGIDIAEPLSRNAGPRFHINFSPKL